MNALSQTTHRLRDRGRKALVAFLTAGYPDEASFVETVRAAVDAGADIVEIGIPFSDPIADGPVIQAASASALARGMTLRRALSLTSELNVDAPLVLMGYVNPVLAMGTEAFARAAAGAGASGVILPDVSFEESAAFRAPLRAAGLSYVDLVAPTSGAARIDAIARAAEGFVYLVSLTGVTGASGGAAADVAGLASRVRAAASVPVYAGFGIAEAEQARATSRHADGVIIGSRLVALAGDGAPAGAAARVGGFLAAVRGALDREGR